MARQRAYFGNLLTEDGTNDVAVGGALVNQSVGTTSHNATVVQQLPGISQDFDVQLTDRANIIQLLPGVSQDFDVQVAVNATVVQQLPDISQDFDVQVTAGTATDSSRISAARPWIYTAPVGLAGQAKRQQQGWAYAGILVGGGGAADANIVQLLPGISQDFDVQLTDRVNVVQLLPGVSQDFNVQHAGGANIVQLLPGISQDFDVQLTDRANVTQLLPGISQDFDVSVTDRANVIQLLPGVSQDFRAVASSREIEIVQSLPAISQSVVVRVGPTTEPPSGEVEIVQVLPGIHQTVIAFLGSRAFWPIMKAGRKISMAGPSAVHMTGSSAVHQMKAKIDGVRDKNQLCDCH